MEIKILYYRDSKFVYSKIYYENDKIHRDNNCPASYFYYPDGTLGSMEYYYNGRFHREDGPAIMTYTRDGKLQHIEYYYFGNYITHLVNEYPTILIDKHLRKILL